MGDFAQAARRPGVDLQVRWERGRAGGGCGGGKFVEAVVSGKEMGVSVGAAGEMGFRMVWLGGGKGVGEGGKQTGGMSWCGRRASGGRAWLFVGPLCRPGRFVGPLMRSSGWGWV